MRDGHDIKNVTIWLKELEDADADKLVAFLKNKGWKGKFGASGSAYDSPQTGTRRKGPRFPRPCDRNLQFSGDPG